MSCHPGKPMRLKRAASPACMTWCHVMGDMLCAKQAAAQTCQVVRRAARSFGSGSFSHAPMEEGTAQPWQPNSERAALGSPVMHVCETWQLAMDAAGDLKVKQCCVSSPAARSRAARPGVPARTCAIWSGRGLAQQWWPVHGARSMRCSGCRQTTRMRDWTMEAAQAGMRMRQEEQRCALSPLPCNRN